MAFGDGVINVIEKYPFAMAAGAALGGYFLLRGSGGGGRGGGFNDDAILASQSINADVNKTLAHAQVAREGITAGRDAVAINAIRDVSLGAQEVAKTDTAMRTATTMQAFEAGQNMAAINADFLGGLTKTAAGFSIARGEVANQKRAIEADFLTGFKEFQTVGDMDYRANQTAMRLAEIDSHTSLSGLGREFDFLSGQAELDISSIPFLTDHYATLLEIEGGISESLAKIQSDTVRSLAEKAQTTQLASQGIKSGGGIIKSIGKIFGGLF